MNNQSVTNATLGKVIRNPNTAPDIVIQAIATELAELRRTPDYQENPSPRRTAKAVIADTIRQGTGDCETCQDEPGKQPTHLAGEVILALYEQGWRVIRTTTP